MYSVATILIISKLFQSTILVLCSVRWAHNCEITILKGVKPRILQYYKKVFVNTSTHMYILVNLNGTMVLYVAVFEDVITGLGWDIFQRIKDGSKYHNEVYVIYGAKVHLWMYMKT